MRISELAKQYGINGKDLQKVLHQAGFAVKSDLQTATDEIIKWVESQPREALVPSKKTKKTVPKKKVKAPAASADKSPSVAREDKPKKAAEAAKIKKPASTPIPPTSPAPTVKAAAALATSAQPPAQSQAQKEEKRAECKKAKPIEPPTLKSKALAKGQPIALGQSPPDAPASESPPTTPESLIVTDEQPKATGQKHRRADFRSLRVPRELPAIFADIESDYAIRSITGGGVRRRAAPRGAGRSTAARPQRRAGAPAKSERDPNAVITLNSGMTIRELSHALGIKLNEIIDYFMHTGKLVQANEILPQEDVVLLAEKFKVKIEWKEKEDLEHEVKNLLADQAAASGCALAPRPPVVTFMGHVDHGKTSLLDKIRQTRVAATEHGGITQHIGAYSVIKNNQRITFLDTPGHEAFTAMRARGATLTDVAVLVVAADDGVMPQTIEAYNHLKNAGIPVVVAINKCDLPSANPARVRQELANKIGLLPEEWGGTCGMVDVSAVTGQGIDALLERILLEAEVLELKADPQRPAVGYVLEAKVGEGQGVVATVLVQQGTLRRGDVVLFSNGYGRIKLMYDEWGRTVETATPGTPVRVSGLSAVPEAGDKICVVGDYAKARQIAEERERRIRSAALARRRHVTLENLTDHLAASGCQVLRIILKADVMGSLEVLQKTLADLARKEVRIEIIHAAVGGVNQADVLLADASDAIIVGFHVVADQTARLQAMSRGVQIKIYHVIYRLIEDIKAALEGLLPPEEREVVLGHAEIRQVFHASRVGNIAGCYVTDGVITRAARVRLIRDSVVIYEGEIASLRRVKDDVREVKSGFECGIKIANYDDIKENDVIEAYTIEEVARKLT